ncbi:MAG TPA: haloacid dehalogenase type II [Burkholderiaceae bacterium]|nr:haloacid dehalogenase type II [Burkholderiaceae bacterium]
MRIRAALFDVFGTLLDVYSVTRRAEELFPGHGARLAHVWRDKQIEYSRLRTLSGRYVPFAQVTREALEFTFDLLGLSPTATQQQDLLDEYKRLTPFVDVLPAFEALHKGGVELGVLSNGDPEMLEAALVGAGLQRHLDLVLSADQVRAFKTDATVYGLGPRALKRPAREILFVSSNGWDACGATWHGYTTCWINRAGLPLERLGVQPDRIGTDLTTVTDFLLKEYA